MILIDAIEVPCGSNETRRIEFSQGDLSSMEKDQAVDVLVVSAFPDDYTPTPSSLIGALYRKRVFVSDLAEAKAVDLRSAFSCWMSQPIQVDDPGIQFRRILCFEPATRSSPCGFVGDIFRAMAPFLGDSPPIKSVAMPLLTSGNQGYPVTEVLPALVDAAVHWFKAGMPLECLRIVSHSDLNAEEGGAVFSRLKQKYDVHQLNSSHGYDYDVFVSYSRKESETATRIKDTLLKHNLSVFFDTQSIDAGAAWQHKIFSALDSCAKMVALYSPSYVASKVCQEEFNIAWARARKLSADIIFPVYWKSANLPTYMEILNYLDCREEATDTVPTMCDALIQSLQEG